MIDYDPSLEVFEDFVDFNSNSECIWVVYPPGAAGDLLASIINSHYVNTSASYRGIAQDGRVIFRPSDFKHTNILMQNGQLVFDETFFAKIVEILASKNCNFSTLDQFIFSNHCDSDADVKYILDTFPNAKIIRITPTTDLGWRIAEWMSFHKNFDKKLDIEKICYDAIDYTLSDQRILNLPLESLLSEHAFEDSYDRIVRHLKLNGKMIRFDFIEFWISRQDEYIKPHLRAIVSN
jgi:hypothetical protein